MGRGRETAQPIPAMKSRPCQHDTVCSRMRPEAGIVFSRWSYVVAHMDGMSGRGEGKGSLHMYLGRSLGDVSTDACAANVASRRSLVHRPFRFQDCFIANRGRLVVHPQPRRAVKVHSPFRSAAASSSARRRPVYTVVLGTIPCRCHAATTFRPPSRPGRS